MMMALARLRQGGILSGIGSSGHGCATPLLRWLCACWDTSASSQESRQSQTSSLWTPSTFESPDSDPSRNGQRHQPCCFCGSYAPVGIHRIRSAPPFRHGRHLDGVCRVCPFNRLAIIGSRHERHHRSHCFCRFRLAKVVAFLGFVHFYANHLFLATSSLTDCAYPLGPAPVGILLVRASLYAG